MDRRRQFKALKKVSFAKFMQENDLMHLLVAGEQVILKTGQILFEEGQNDFFKQSATR